MLPKLVDPAQQNLKNLAQLRNQYHYKKRLLPIVKYIDWLQLENCSSHKRLTVVHLKSFSLRLLLFLHGRFFNGFQCYGMVEDQEELHPVSTLNQKAFGATSFWL